MSSDTPSTMRLYETLCVSIRMVSLSLPCSESRRNRPNSHVQFAVDTNLDTGLIQLERREGGIVEAHIGMIKNHHTYSAEIPVTHSLGKIVTVLS